MSRAEDIGQDPIKVLANDGERFVGSGRPLIEATTEEQDVPEAEHEFMQAIEAYKRRSGRMFPTWSEVLEILRSLGYRKPEPGDSEPASIAPDSGC